MANEELGDAKGAASGGAGASYTMGWGESGGAGGIQVFSLSDCVHCGTFIWNLKDFRKIQFGRQVMSVVLVLNLRLPVTSAEHSPGRGSKAGQPSLAAFPFPIYLVGLAGASLLPNVWDMEHLFFSFPYSFPWFS